MNYAQPPMMPVAKALANQGRMTDSTLVHMNPQEVAGLQSLARQNGTSLTINPQTGLPEAFNLSSILPVVAGAALTPVLGPVGAAMAVGGIGGLMSGSIEQGLMMGLGAYGGAGLAGSAANLAAPAAMAASAPTTAAIAAPSAMGTTGIMASGAPATTLAGATQLAPAASVGGLGLQAPALSAITPATTAAAGSSLVPTATGGLAATVSPSVQATAPFATATPIADVIPSAASSSISPPSGIGRLFQTDDNVTYENIGTGLKKAFSSGESAMDFLGQNKMNLAMSAAPMLMSPEEEAEIERQRAMIRPYEYQVDNLSGTDVDPFGVERERLRGRFVAGTPYYAAKGGVVPFAEGGSTSGSTTTAPTTTTSTAPATLTLTPAEADVYRNIFAVQQLAGMPMGIPTAPASSTGIAGLPNFFTMAPSAPRAPVAYTPSMVGTAPALDTSERRYEVFNPIGVTRVEETASSGDDGYIIPVGGFFPRRIFGRDFSGELAPSAFNEGGSVLNAGGIAGLKKGRFLDDTTDSTGNSDGMSDSMPGVINGEQPARLTDGEFVVPADVVSHLGNGSSKAGAKRLHNMMDRIRKARTNTKKQAPAVKAEKYMPA